ncbi:Mis12 domain-containing protein [Beauveria bassiana ARSEF 2860]|uniref:Mis12 domain-containing protein n=1 Tax=Beauveria bassiana (strain ARSEF 2860) TaxID=655819 RepID=J4WBI2_BEAB2|nr:Mis12 domain-containing protein [Beauveria bassiana ARSEF 2860]EJP67470.1 Mis12 domain-containing protein [Beauveria bassiana ARSEF 2860]
MSAPDNAEYELLTEHFSYPPVSLLDDIINAVNVLADRALGAVETALTKLPAQSLGFGGGGGPSKKRGAPGADPPAAPDTATTTPSPDEAAKREIEHGTHQLETLLNASIDKNFDIFELYVMRNILTVKPDDQPYMQLAHYQGLDFDAPPAAAGADAQQQQQQPTLDSVTQLRRRLHASQKLQVALETERVRNDALLRTLRAAVGVSKPAASASVKKEDGEAAGGDDAEKQQQQQQQTDTLGFLHNRGTLEEGGTERPITTTTEFILAQLQTLRSLSTSLRSLIPDIDDDGDDKDNGDADDAKDGKSWRRERAEYIETASRRYLETVAGVELGPAGEVRDGEWQGPGRGLARDEVEGLEAVAAALGAQQQQQQQQQQPATEEAPAPAQEQVPGSGAGQDEDEDMAKS